MIKKTAMTTMILIMVLIAAVQIPVFAGSKIVAVDETHAVVTISYEVNSDSDLRVAVVHKDGKQFYPFTYSGQKFSLPFGDGSYVVGIYERVEGNSFALKAEESIRVNVDEESRYLASAYNVDWNQDDAAIRIAKTLTDGATTDQEKVERIYAFVTDSIQYDYDKAASVRTGYVPDIDQTIQSSSGICYDYASLTAAMLRSVDIPTKLHKGYSDELSTYHAWNSVLVDGEWKLIDATFDAANSAEGFAVQMYKNENSYQSEKVF
jgi:hypothetical protein